MRLTSGSQSCIDANFVRRSFIHMTRLVYNSTNWGVNAAARSLTSPYILIPGAREVLNSCFAGHVSMQLN